MDTVDPQLSILTSRRWAQEEERHVFFPALGFDAEPNVQILTCMLETALSIRGKEGAPPPPPQKKKKKKQKTTNKQKKIVVILIVHIPVDTAITRA